MPQDVVDRNHREYRRDGLRYASDLTADEWKLIEPHLPPAKPLGRRRATDLRQAVNAMLYLWTAPALQGL